MKTTEIFYVLSPDKEEQLFYSLYTLLSSETVFDRIQVICIGDEVPKHWDFQNDRLKISAKEKLDANYFHINKCYINLGEADRIVFLDADTFIFRPLHEVWDGVEQDFCAREATHKFRWNRWNRLIKKVRGAQVPYFNCGFFMVQNDKLHELCKLWLEFCYKGFSKELFNASRLHMAITVEQLALSLAVSKLGYSFKEMNEWDHWYAWTRARYPTGALYPEGLNQLHLYHTCAYYYQECLEQFKELNLVPEDPLTWLRENR